MTRVPGRPLLTVAVLVWLLLELLRGWTPLLITVFGRAAETPPELIGAFALGVTAIPVLVTLAAPAVVSTRWALPTLTVVALAARLTLPFLAGRPLLVVASIGVPAALLALALGTARLGNSLVPGLFAGIALAATTHAALGTWGGVWRTDVSGIVVAAVLVALVVLCRPTLTDTTTAPARPGVAWLVLPVLLLAGIALANPARALVTHSLGAVVVALAATVAAGLALRAWSPAARAGAAVGMVAATAVTMLPDPLPTWTLVGFAVGMPCLAIVLTSPGAVAGPGSRPAASARALSAGVLVFTALLFAFYAGYDLGYRADWLVVLVALVVTAAALLGSRAPLPRGSATYSSDDPGPPAGPGPRLAAAALAGALLLAGAGPALTVIEEPRPAVPEDRTVGIAAYNLRMGYGIDGTFRPGEVTDLLAREQVDVALLSEVDRGWLLNGGQDQLSVMARRLGDHLAFGPAGDQVWGDAILSRYPLTDVRRVRLPAYDSLTGAQILAATVTLPDGPAVRVVSTHVQPDSGGPEGTEDTLRQAEDIADFVSSERERTGLPIVLGGDFNVEPDTASWRAVLAAGLVDALAPARPLLTSSSDAPERQIDHVFVTPDLATTDPRTIPTLLSDHRPVLVDVTLP